MLNLQAGINNASITDTTFHSSRESRCCMIWQKFKPTISAMIRQGSCHHLTSHTDLWAGAILVSEISRMLVY